MKWTEFIFERNIQAKVCKNPFMSANDFESNCFTSLGQDIAELGMKLFPKEGSVPTVCGKTVNKRNVSIYNINILCNSLDVKYKLTFNVTCKVIGIICCIVNIKFIKFVECL